MEYGLFEFDPKKNFLLADVCQLHFITILRFPVPALALRAAVRSSEKLTIFLTVGPLMLCFLLQFGHYVPMDTDK